MVLVKGEINSTGQGITLQDPFPPLAFDEQVGRRTGEWEEKDSDLPQPFFILTHQTHCKIDPGEKRESVLSRFQNLGEESWPEAHRGREQLCGES